MPPALVIDQHGLPLECRLVAVADLVHDLHLEPRVVPHLVTIEVRDAGPAHEWGARRRVDDRVVVVVVEGRFEVSSALGGPIRFCDFTRCLHPADSSLLAYWQNTILPEAGVTGPCWK
jgi:NADPH-dependent ferric siderophore reductase